MQLRRRRRSCIDISLLLLLLLGQVGHQELGHRQLLLLPLLFFVAADAAGGTGRWHLARHGFT